MNPALVPEPGVAALLGVTITDAVTGEGGAEATAAGCVVRSGGLDLAVLLGLPDLAVVHAGVPQAQGDVAALPWPAHTAPSVRAQAVRGARPVPLAGWAVLTGRGGHTHTLLADGPGVRAGADPCGLDLAVVVVAGGSVAVLAHEDHPDLHLGEGVYTLRRQRRHTPEEPESLTAYVHD